MHEPNWLTLAKRLEAIASTGLFFGESEFDRERYHEVHEIAKQMLADIGEVPINVLNELFNSPGQGYETPKVDVRGAVFRDDKILLVREKLDGLWTLPGGYADVCISPKENIEKEIAEEANIEVKANRLFAVIHKARHEYDVDARDFYKFYFLCEQKETANPKPGAETMGAEFFPLDALPTLSTGRTIEKHIKLAVEYRNDPTRATYFD